MKEHAPAEVAAAADAVARGNVDPPPPVFAEWAARASAVAEESGSAHHRYLPINIAFQDAIERELLRARFASPDTQGGGPGASVPLKG